MLRSARRARLEARATVMQVFAQFLHMLESGKLGVQAPLRLPPVQAYSSQVRAL
jgi:hypothetical protein